MKRMYVVLVIIVLVLLALWAGLEIGSRDNTNQDATTRQSTDRNATARADLDSLITYRLPEGWNEETCPGAENTVFIVPSGTSLDCEADQPAPIKILLTDQSLPDCQQLQPTTVQGIRTHTCRSLFIDGHKTVKALTERDAGGLAVYYLDTNEGVVAFEYSYTTPANDFMTGFDQLAMSTRVEG